MRKILATTFVATMAAAGFMLAPAAQAATAVPGNSAASATADHPAPASQALNLVCTVNDNGVNFRGGPGTNYPVLGVVNQGQNLDYRGRTGDWIFGNLWGGPTGVWIYVAYLNNC
ncbi:SH3 domain-containing protein [Embleya sp. AB8]|uniref:SH3 domain-containing protein n=1 Tax=Embleya sp. AB8 TaxID=3156304 RepID=UPI003C743675